MLINQNKIELRDLCANSIKFMIFSAIGYVVFSIVAVFFPFLVFLPTGFGILTALSFVVYVFQKIKTRHHFITLGLTFFIFGFFFF